LTPLPPVRALYQKYQKQDHHFSPVCFYHPTDFCRLPENDGEGTQFSFAFYYNASTDQCYPFLYKGQGGNANRFLNEIQCIRNCSTNADNFYPMEATQACHFRKAEGGCSGKFLRFYYDSVHDKCKKFLWTGCFGNGNRFFDYNSCNTTCAGIHGEHVSFSYAHRC
ncbi:hypothetical protein L3Q82_023909, partial [Scortum barcoo]